jgi:uncharacterized membrane protein
MNKLLRIIAGVIVIVLGLLIGLFSISVWPHPLNWATVFLLFAPVATFAVALIAIGWAILQGMSRKEAIELLMFLWH